MFFWIQFDFMKYTLLQIRTGHTFCLATTDQYLAPLLRICRNCLLNSNWLKDSWMSQTQNFPSEGWFNVRLMIHSGRKEEDWRRNFVLSFPNNFESKNHAVLGRNLEISRLCLSQVAEMSSSDQMVCHTVASSPKWDVSHPVKEYTSLLKNWI